MWSILCPGKSLEQLPRKETPWQNAIAVNTAALYAPVQYWCCLDIEAFRVTLENMDDREAAYLARMGQRLVCPQRWRANITRQAPDHVEHFDRMSKEYFDHVTKQGIARNLPAWAKVGDWTGYTMFCAMAFAIRHGATWIRIFGADLGGSGYFRPGVENEKTQHHAKRWSQERERFQELITLCATHGVKVTRENVEDEPRTNMIDREDVPGMGGDVLDVRSVDVGDDETRLVARVDDGESCRVVDDEEPADGKYYAACVDPECGWHGVRDLERECPECGDQLEPDQVEPADSDNGSD